MKWLLYGSKGWIGSQVYNLLIQRNDEVVCGKVRVDNEDALMREIDKVSPTHIICTIGRTYGPNIPTIDYLEQKDKLVENLRDNLYSPLLLAMICREYGIHLTYLGTGCIFESENVESSESFQFDEHDLPNFFGSSYSTVKGFTDRLMHFYGDTVLNLRIRMPISDQPSPRNMITKLLNYEKICSISNSMSVLPDLLPEMIRLASEYKTGTLNFVNPGVITHNEILILYQQKVDPNFTWNNFTQEEQAQILRAGRSNNALDTTKLQKWCPNVPDIHTSITNLISKYSH